MVEALCLDDLDAFGTELDDPLAELAQDLYHRVIESPGSNLDDPDRGFGLWDRLNGSGRQGALAESTKHGLEAEMRKARGVHAAQANITESSKGEYAIDLAIVCDEGELGISLVADGNGVRRVA